MIPSATQPLVNPTTGVITPEWLKHFAEADAGRIVSVTLTGSPFAYQASGRGHVLITGGTVSGVTLNRARVTVATGLTSGFVPASAGDVLTITYTVAPSVSFIPE